VTLFDVDVAVVGGRTMRAAVALPADGEVFPAPYPGVVVIHDLWGLTDDIRAKCAQFADHGYAAIAPDLMTAGSRVGCIARLIGDLHRFAVRGQTIDLLEAAREELGRYPAVDRDRTAVIGFRLGGAFALAYGVHGSLRAAAVNYGQVPKDIGPLRAACPVVGAFGAEDRTLRGHPQRLAAALSGFGIEHDVKVYPGAGHGFLGESGGPAWLARFAASMGMGYRPEQAADAWRRIFAFFDEHVRGTRT
jgi:carboxymethylenebutenolidase